MTISVGTEGIPFSSFKSLKDLLKNVKQTFNEGKTLVYLADTTFNRELSYQKITRLISKIVEESPNYYKDENRRRIHINYISELAYDYSYKALPIIDKKIYKRNNTQIACSNIGHPEFNSPRNVIMKFVQGSVGYLTGTFSPGVVINTGQTESSVNATITSLGAKAGDTLRLGGGGNLATLMIALVDTPEQVKDSIMQAINVADDLKKSVADELTQVVIGYKPVRDEIITIEEYVKSIYMAPAEGIIKTLVCPTKSLTDQAGSILKTL